jgi:hypothetical protein
MINQTIKKDCHGEGGVTACYLRQSWLEYSNLYIHLDFITAIERSDGSVVRAPRNYVLQTQA